MFIIDFDDTLFNTRPGFADARVKALSALGVSKDQYLATYLKARNDANGLVNYNDRRHAQMLALEGFDEEKIFEAFQSTMTPERLKEFLFPDTISFLEKIKSYGEPMVLLSLGDAEFQSIKLKRLGLERYFDRVFMTSEPKTTVMAEIIHGVSDTSIWFINDKPEETKELVQFFPKIKPLLKQCSRFSESEYKALDLPYFKTLTGIQNFIETWHHTVPVILAAGEGKRMGGSLPKVMHILKEKPIIEHVVGTMEQAGLPKPVVVVNSKHELVQQRLGDRALYAVQAQQLGTGHAVLVSQNAVGGEVANVCVLYGDMPFVSSATVATLVQKHIVEGADVTLATVSAPNFAGKFAPLDAYGRIVRNEAGHVKKIIERKDATETEIKIREVNTGVYCFKTEVLWSLLKKVENKNAQGEYYLTDVVALALTEGKKVQSIVIPSHEGVGVNTKEDLGLAEKL